MSSTLVKGTNFYNMGKTYRKDKKDIKRTEYCKKQDGWYYCRCEYCTSLDKIAYKEKLGNKKIKEGIKEFEERYDD